MELNQEQEQERLLINALEEIIGQCSLMATTGSTTDYYLEIML